MTTTSASTLQAGVSTGEGRSGLSALVAVACLVTLARVAYLVLACPYNLVEDEAQYWLWSTHLEWSYATKGPGIAWAIALSTSIYGEAEWAVRLPAAIFSGIAVFAAGGLARDLARAVGLARPVRVAVASALMFAVVPFFQLSAVIVTIDGPLIACWAVAAWAAWRALRERSWCAWLVFGAAVGVGFLFKYTMLLVVPGVLLHAWLFRPTLSLSPRWKLAAFAAAVLACLGMVPVVIWNAQHDWATVRHLLGHLGLPGGDQPPAAGGSGRRWFEWLPIWPLQLALAQIGMVGPILIGAACGVWRLWRRSNRGRSGQDVQGSPGLAMSESKRGAWLYAVHIAAPILLFYAVVAWIAEPEGNWPIAGSVTLVPLGVLLAFGAPSVLTGRARRWVPRVAILGAAYGFLAIGPLHRADFAASVVNRVMFWGPMSKIIASMRADGQPPRPIVTGRLIGAQTMGQAVGRAMAEARTYTGREPFVLAQHYGRASQMAYYAPWPSGQDGGALREATCASAYTGGRRTAFDDIGRLRLDRPELLGRPAVILSNDSEHMLAQWKRMFETVIPYVHPESPGGGRLPGENKRDRVAYLGLGFKGVGANP
ncbi:MAG: glycosyltransferase family 39 protein [Phycisphaeraceae bacterium]|nr:glycosyltransferase family 39 protein [Phycisphaeraceae bacterium]